ncbi:DUF6048 family protein [Flavobacterium sp. NKUCC04_CG]|uniref:DUF6048 family protein n=1 Tax=Flavobacterium sp. NKUCC04_CG TaxID=2842121 RepID=UPI001C5B0491|nr:DUF6048 family protein [Flavobacterium sp. NKUCC04_CG]MBW3517953.1 hypothetical protein [Flavobacterium sp. NKUCC04_CG]
MSTLKYIISLGFVCLSSIGSAQDTITPFYPQRYGLRVGTDLYRAARNFYDKDYNGFEIDADYRLSKRWFAAAELGKEKITKDEDQLNFTTNGSFIKVGVDFNAHQNWMDLENMIYAGFRYGFSSFSQNLNSYTIYSPNSYFDKTLETPNKKFSGLTAHWLEFVAGIRTRIFDNVFLGFSVRLNGLVYQKEPENFENLYIPGYNKKYSGGIGVGMNYSISYLIPLYKSQKVVIPPVEVNPLEESKPSTNKK